MRSSVPIIGVVRGEKFYQSCVCLYDDGLICLWVISSTGDNNILIEGISHLPIVEDRDASTDTNGRMWKRGLCVIGISYVMLFVKVDQMPLMRKVYLITYAICINVMNLMLEGRPSFQEVQHLRNCYWCCCAAFVEKLREEVSFAF